MNPKATKPSEGNIEISQSCQLPAPEEWKGFPVHKKDWERIKKMVDKIVSPTSFWQIVWPASFGIAATSFIGSFAIPEKNHPNKTICYWLFLLFLVIGILSLIVEKTHKKVSTYTKDQLKEEIEKMEEPYKTSEGYSAQQGVSGSANEKK